MNISGEEVLGSIISKHQINEDHLLYIGIGIGLSSGLLCLIVIAHYKYIKHKNKQPINDLSNDKDDTTIINNIIDWLDTRRPIQVV